jgi:hypothetical protein
MRVTMKPGSTMRVARPTDNLAAIAEMYAKGLGFAVLAEFKDHRGFDGVILGHPRRRHHIEFTSQREHQVGKAPTQDHLLIFYVPNKDEWEGGCAQKNQPDFARCRHTIRIGTCRAERSKISMAIEWSYRMRRGISKVDSLFCPCWRPSQSGLPAPLTLFRRARIGVRFDVASLFVHHAA